MPHAHLHLIRHNNEGSDYKKALEKLGNMQENPNRRISSEEGEKITEKLKLHS